MNSYNKIDVPVGTRYGRLVALGEGSKNPRGGQRRIKCRCDCGIEREIVLEYLRRGVTQSCGCLQREKAGGTTGGRRTHGLSASPEYGPWQAMKDRCLNPRSRAWANYGGRGITVCQEWATSFEAFLAAVGPRPSLKHTLGRFENDGNYEPGNAGWQTPAEQGANRRPAKRTRVARPEGSWVWRGRPRQGDPL